MVDDLAVCLSEYSGQNGPAYARGVQKISAAVAALVDPDAPKSAQLQRDDLKKIGNAVAKRLLEAARGSSLETADRAKATAALVALGRAHGLLLDPNEASSVFKAARETRYRGSRSGDEFILASIDLLEVFPKSGPMSELGELAQRMGEPADVRVKAIEALGYVAEGNPNAGELPRAFDDIRQIAESRNSAPAIRDATSMALLRTACAFKDPDGDKSSGATEIQTRYDQLVGLIKPPLPALSNLRRRLIVDIGAMPHECPWLARAVYSLQQALSQREAVETRRASANTLGRLGFVALADSDATLTTLNDQINGLPNENVGSGFTDDDRTSLLVTDVVAVDALASAVADTASAKLPFNDPTRKALSGAFRTLKVSIGQLPSDLPIHITLEDVGRAIDGAVLQLDQPAPSTSLAKSMWDRLYGLIHPLHTLPERLTLFLGVLLPIVLLIWFVWWWIFLMVAPGCIVFCDEVLPRWRWHFLGLRLSTRPAFRLHPRVLSVRTELYLDRARRSLQSMKTVQERRFFKRIPGLVDGRRIPEVDAATFREFFTGDQCRMLITANAGGGKTALACHIADRLMSKDPAERPCRRPTIPVLIERDLNEATGETFLQMVTGSFAAMIGSPRRIDDATVEALLRNRNIVVILDGFSERNAYTRRTIEFASWAFPANVVIVTSRIPERLDGLPRTMVDIPLLSDKTLAEFVVDVYLANFGVAAEVSNVPAPPLLNWELTALFAKLYAERLAERSKAARTENVSERVIPQVILEYVNLLNREAGPGDPDKRQVQSDLKAAAWCCIQPSLKAHTVSRAQLAQALEGPNAAARLEYLISRLNVLRTVDADENRVAFSFDLLAEYFAADFLLDDATRDWEKFAAEVAMKPESHRFVEALVDTLAYRESNGDLSADGLDGVISKLISCHAYGEAGHST